MQHVWLSRGLSLPFMCLKFSLDLILKIILLYSTVVLHNSMKSDDILDSYSAAFFVFIAQKHIKAKLAYTL